MGFVDKLKKQNSQPEVILESNSPVCELQALVEKSDTCYYFYLWGNPTSDRCIMKSCWICNRKKAPKTLNVDAMKQGNESMMTEEYVAHDLGGMELDASKLEIVWFAEGDAASLLYNGELLCVIPGWANAENRFPGYSKYAKGNSEYAWELGRAEPVLMNRTQKSKKFWNSFSDSFWATVQEEHMIALKQLFGAHEKYYAIDGGKFPPKALVAGSRDGKVYGITAGVSLIPMPLIEQCVEAPEKHRRMELGFATIKQHRGLCDHMYMMMSSLAAYPWKYLTFFAHGHTIPFPKINGFAALLFVNPKFVPEVEMPPYLDCMGDDINLLWLVLITQEEYEFSLNQGSQELLKRATDLGNIHVFDGKAKFI